MGNLWLKIKSKEVSGQFAAQARVDSRGELDLEVLNFLGGTEAVIQVRGTRYEVRDSHGKKVQEGVGENGVWAGLPMRWAHDLFLGRTPCPDLQAKADGDGDVRSEWLDEGVLRLTAPLSVTSRDPAALQEFNYRLRGKPGELVPESLQWSTRTSDAVSPAEKVSVEFRFDNVDSKTGSFRKWEAHSNRGDLKVVWRDRELVKRASLAPDSN